MLDDIICNTVLSTPYPVPLAPPHSGELVTRYGISGKGIAENEEVESWVAGAAI